MKKSQLLTMEPTNHYSYLIAFQSDSDFSQPVINWRSIRCIMTFMKRWKTIEASYRKAKGL